MPASVAPAGGRDQARDPDACFCGLGCRGAKKVTLGSKMLFASQCVVLVHHAPDDCRAKSGNRCAGSAL
jgi:hypothetical protein